MKLEGTGTIVDAYNDGSADFHQMIADMAGIERKQAKTINLGIMYGMGKNKLMAELGLMKDAAEKLLKTYHQKAPFVKMLSEAVADAPMTLVRLERLVEDYVTLICGSPMVLVLRNH